MAARFWSGVRLIGGRKGNLEPRLLEFAAGVFLDLLGEQRHEIEGRCTPGNSSRIFTMPQ